jgi:HAD superfamily phosphatase (TIGR01668 family)
MLVQENLETGKDIIMLKRFYPNAYYNSAYSIDYRQLYKKGYRGIIFDVDNTLVEHGAPVTDRAVKLFADLREIGFETCIISNNSEPRVKPLADQVGTRYVSKAHKPSPVNYVKAMRLMGTDTTNSLFIGDQLFTDVWGANRAGMKTILVEPIDSHEEIQIVLKRYIERIVLRFYKKHGSTDYILLPGEKNRK